MTDSLLRSFYSIEIKRFNDPERKKEIEFEENIIEDISRLIEKQNKNGCVHHYRMFAVADALFKSGALTLFDDDFNLETLFNAIYSIKIKAHSKLLNAIFSELKKQKCIDIKNAFESMPDYYSYIFEVEKHQVLIYETENQDRYAFIKKYRNEKDLSLKCILLPITNEDAKELVHNSIKNKRIQNVIFEFSFNDSSAKIKKESHIKETLAIINHLASSLNIDFDLKY